MRTSYMHGAELTSVRSVIPILLLALTILACPPAYSQNGKKCPIHNCDLEDSPNGKYCPSCVVEANEEQYILDSDRYDPSQDGDEYRVSKPVQASSDSQDETSKLVNIPVNARELARFTQISERVLNCSPRLPPTIISSPYFTSPPQAFYPCPEAENDILMVKLSPDVMKLIAKETIEAYLKKYLHPALIQLRNLLQCHGKFVSGGIPEIYRSIGAIDAIKMIRSRETLSQHLGEMRDNILIHPAGTSLTEVLQQNLLTVVQLVTANGNISILYFARDPKTNTIQFNFNNTFDSPEFPTADADSLLIQLQQEMPGLNITIISFLDDNTALQLTMNPQTPPITDDVDKEQSLSEVCSPPSAEQQAIAHHLERAITRIPSDEAISFCPANEINLLQKHCGQNLINAIPPNSNLVSAGDNVDGFIFVLENHLPLFIQVIPTDSGMPIQVLQIQPLAHQQAAISFNNNIIYTMIPNAMALVQWIFQQLPLQTPVTIMAFTLLRSPGFNKKARH